MTAQEIFNKIESNTIPGAKFGVFVRGSNVRMTRTTTDLFNRSVSAYPSELMGIYNRDALVEWIAEDLKFMGAACA